MKKIIVLAFVVALTSLPVGAGAHVVSDTDPNDVSGKLDIRRYGMEHGNKILFGVKFDQRVRKSYFAGADTAGFNLELSGDAFPDKQVGIRRKNGKLKCIVTNENGENPQGSVTADKSGAKVECKLPNRLLNRTPNAFNAFSFFNDQQDSTDIIQH